VKNKLLIVIIVILCLIPSVVAVLNYKTSKTAPVDMSTATTVVINDIAGRTYQFDKASENTEESAQAEALINFFMKMNEDASSITGLPDSLLGEKFYKITLSNTAREESYEYYFSADPTTCYYRTQSGNTYKITEADAREFLATTYAESVYPSAALPVLTLAHTTAVTPDIAEWNYVNISGSLSKAVTDAYVTEEIESYDLSGGLDLAFDLNPDYCSVKVTDEAGSAVWEGMLADLSKISLDSTKKVKVAVVAKWYNDSSRDYCGEIDYVFGTVLTAPASFYLSMDEVRAGKFIAVTATNILKPSAIEVSSDMPTTVVPVFYQAEDNLAVGLMPIDIDTPAGTYNITLKYGGTSETLALKVEENYVSTSGLSISEAVVSATRTNNTLEEFSKACDEIMATGSETRYFKGSFLEGITATITRGFGRDIYLNGSSTVTYRTNGVDYSAAAGTEVVAANDGEVVFAKLLDYSGYTVVIEHGYGLKTWYYNLGAMNVEVGDKVEQGDKIGEAGSTGFYTNVGAHIAMSVGNTFVCPYDTWADSEIAGKVVIALIDELDAENE